MKKFLLVSSVLAALGLQSSTAQISLTGTSYSQDFDIMGPTGTTTPSGWFVGTGTAAVSATTVTVGAGTSTSGGNYNFGTGSSVDRALGSLASASTVRVTEVRFVNNTGGYITSFTVDYTGEQWRCGGTSAVANTLTMRYSTDGVTFTDLGSTFNFVSPVVTGTAAALDGNSPANRTINRGGTYTPSAAIPPGAVFYLRWADPDDGSSDHGLAVDDFSLTTTQTTAQYWDTDGSTAGLGGTGSWDGTSLNWNPLGDGTGTTVAFDSSKTAQFSGTAGAVTVDAGGVTSSAGLIFAADGYTIQGGTVTLDTVNAVAVGSSQTATISAPIAGSAGLSKSGAGTLVLSGANTFSGDVAILGGTLAVGGGSAIADASTVTPGGNTLSLNGSETVGAVVGAGTVALNGNTLTIDNAAASTFSGTATGEGTFAKKGAGTLTFSSTTSTYTGSTRLEDGTLVVNGTVRLGHDTNVLEFAGGGLANSISRTITNAVKMTGNVLLTTPGLSSGTRGLTFLSGTFENTAGTITIRNVGTGGINSVRLREGGLNISRDIVIGDAGDVGGLVGAILRCDHQSGGDQILSGNISGPGIFERNNNSVPGVYGLRTILTGDNSYSGGTHLKGGFIGIGSANTFGTGNISIGYDPGHLGLFAHGGAREVTNAIIFEPLFSGSATNLHIGGSEPLTLSGPVTLHTANSSHLTVSNSAVTTISGVISGTVGITKSGSGVLELSADNAYAGNTVVNGGTLLARNGTGSATGTGNVVVNNGGTFGGDGIVSGTVTLNSGATIAAGATVESLDTGSQTWEGGASAEVEMVDGIAGAGSGWDVININGGLAINATAGNKFTIHVTADSAPSNFDNTQTGEWIILTTTTGITGFDASAFEVVQSGFVGAGFGTFKVAQDGNNLVLRFVFSPIITSQPASQNVAAGGSASFTVVAVGSPTLTYQWKKNGSDISGATDDSYLINVVTGTDAGSYTVVVANSDGTATSSAAVLSVSPTIGTAPVGATKNPGESVTFSVVADGEAPLAYQWKKDGADITDATDASYTINSIQGVDHGDYTVLVSNAAGSDLSATATLAVSPEITQQPESTVPAATGDNVSVSVTATGSPTLTYQWKKGGVNVANDTVISGANTATLTFTSIRPGDAGTYTVLVSNGAGSLESAASVISVQDTPVITAQPESQTIGAGTNVTFTVANTGAEPLTYIWKLNDVALVDGGRISGATTTALTITGAAIADAGNYTVAITNSSGGVVSAIATLTVIEPPVIDVEPSSQTKLAGETATFTATVSGTAPAFQWKKDGTDLVDGGSISGATTATLTITSVTLADAGSYTLTATNLAGEATTAAATLTVNQAPTITAQPADQTTSRGGSATFTVTAEGYPLNYQWRKNGSNIADATGSALILEDVSTDDIAYYSVVVSNEFGSETSSSALLSINNAVVFAEDFDVDVTSEWTVNKSSNPGGSSAEFNFDYSTVGIPAAPNSEGASTRGLRLRANMTGATFSGLSVSPTGKSFTGDYILHCDMWLNANGPFPGGGSGSTQVTGVGVGTAGTTAQWAGGVQDSIHFGMTAEGGSAQDYRAYSPAAPTMYTAGTGVYAAGTGTSPDARNELHPYYSDLGSKTAPAAQLALYSQQSGTTSAGAAGMAWRNVVVARTNGVTRFSVDGKIIATINNAGLTLGGDNILFNYYDINATISSESNATNLLFGLIDNVRVESLAVEAPLIVSQPASQNVNAGTTATLSVTASSSSPLRYQWRFNGTDISGATDSSLAIENVLAANAGDYSVLVMNESSAVLSSTAALTVVDPAINTQPLSLTRAVGTSAEFTVAAAGTGTLTYQWKKGGVNVVDGGDISGATSSTLTIANVQPGDAGSYTVEVTGTGTVESDAAVLTVQDPGITAQPVSQTLGAGVTANFSVSALGTGTLTYQWQKDGVPLSNGGNVSGADSATLTLTGISQADAASYTVVVTGDNGSVTSDAATLTVIDPPTITSQPVSATNNYNTSVTFTVAATGTGLTYQWQKDGVDLVDAGNISGSTTATLAISSLTGADAADYQVILTTLGGTVPSSVATLTVIDPLITSNPSARLVSAGDKAVFSANATGSPTLTYQRQKDGVNVSDSAKFFGASTLSLTNTMVDDGDAGSYAMVASNTYSDATSSSAPLTVIGSILKTIVRWDFNSTEPDAAVGTGNSSPIIGAGSIAAFGGTGPVGSTFSAGATADPAASDNSAFHTTTYRSADPNKSAGVQVNTSTAGRENIVISWYQQVSNTGSKYWRLQYSTDGVSFVDSDVVTINSGGTTEFKVVDLSAIPEVDNNPNFAIRIVTEFEDTATGAGAAAYLRASGAVGVIDAGTARFDLLTVFGDVLPPVIVTQPESQAVTAGDPATFTVVASGGLLNYQWSKDGTPLVDGDGISGATTATLAIAAASLADEGVYTVEVSNPLDSVTSDGATLTIAQPPVIGSLSENLVKNEGQPASFTVTLASGSAPFTYQWSKDGNPIIDATDATYTITATSTNDAGSYTVEVSNAYGSASSGPITLSVADDATAPKLVVLAPKANFIFTNGPSLTITGIVSDAVGVASVKYSLNGSALDNATLSHFAVPKPSNWVATATMQAGTNRLDVIATDLSGNAFTNKTITFFYHVPSTFTYAVTKEGVSDATITPLLSAWGTPNNGAQLNVGRTYKIKAQVLPGTNSIITNITYTAAGGDTGVLFTNTAVLPTILLNFTMKTNMHIDFNTRQNPLNVFGGLYYGLFSDKTNGVAHHSAGYAQIKITSKYTYSAKVIIDGNTVGFGGKLPIDGKLIDRVVSRYKATEKGDLKVSFNVDMTGNDKITGSVSEVTNTWVSELEADRMVWSLSNTATNWTNAYTAIVPGFTNKADGPIGSTYGVLSVDVKGKAKWIGGAGDYEVKGSPVVGVTYLSKEGYWPFYAPMYKAKRALARLNALGQPVLVTEYNGAMMGWLQLTTNNLGNLRPEGEVSWIKTGLTNILYSGGFTNLNVPITASRWLAPTSVGQYPLDSTTTNWNLTFTEGNLATPYVAATLLYTNKVVAVKDIVNKPAAALAIKTGLMKGTFLHPSDSTTVSKWFGVALQDMNVGEGWVMGPSEGGKMEFAPAAP